MQRFYAGGTWWVSGCECLCSWSERWKLHYRKRIYSERVGESKYLAWCQSWILGFSVDGSGRRGRKRCGSRSCVIFVTGLRVIRAFFRTVHFTEQAASFCARAIDIDIDIGEESTIIMVSFNYLALSVPFGCATKPFDFDKQNRARLQKICILNLACSLSLPVPI